MAAFSQLIIRHIEQGVRIWTSEWDYSITQNFLSQGRPDRWKATRRGGRILQHTNRLHSSIDVKYARTGETLFTMKAVVPLKYGRIHQYGGWIRPKAAKALAIPITREARERPPRDWPKKGPGRLYSYTSTKGTVFLAVKEGKTVKNHFVLMTAVYIPARPYIVIQDGDKTRFKQIMRGAVQAAKDDGSLFGKLAA